MKEKSCNLALKKTKMTAYIIPLGMFGTTEIILIVLALLLLFGGKKIPELMRGLGTGIKEFKNAAKDQPGAEQKNQENQ